MKPANQTDQLLMRLMIDRLRRADKNPRADSKLKRLPEDRQAQIIERMKTPGVTQTQVRSELAKDGLKTSEPALSEFFSWWHLRHRLNSKSNVAQSEETAR